MIKLSPVLYVVGLLNAALGAAMAATAIYAALAGGEDAGAFALAAAATLFVAGALVLSNRGERMELTPRQAFVLTVLAWVSASGFAALPFVFSRDVGFTDAFFEAISGLTTTGSTVLTGLDDAPRALLLWRSLLQGMGGIGIIVMAIAILPFLQVGGMQLFKTESSDRTEKVLPRPGQTAAAIARVYVALIAICAVAYSAAGMDAFDAINHAMTTVATGGYSTHDASIGYFASAEVEVVGIAFMILGALPFVLYIRALQTGPEAVVRDPQVRAFLLMLGAAVAIAAIWLVLARDETPLGALRLAAFNIVSIATTTGFASADYNLWGPLPGVLFLLVMFMGGCSGSTSGAIKVFRFQVMIAAARAHVSRLLHAHAVAPRSFGAMRISDEVVTSVAVFLGIYFVSVALLALILAGFGLDLVTSVSSAVNALGNIGPGLGDVVGPAGNFASLPDGAKWALALGMLLGRLELMTVLVLFLPRFWRG